MKRSSQDEYGKDKKIEAGNQPTIMASDQQSAQVVKQALKDDQALALVAKDIKVIVKDGEISLNGEVATKEQSDLASNTAKALGGVDEVDNNLEVKPI